MFSFGEKGALRIMDIKGINDRRHPFSCDVISWGWLYFVNLIENVSSLMTRKDSTAKHIAVQHQSE
jgi:hypothetical protein